MHFPIRIMSLVKEKKKKKRLSSIQFHSALSNPDQKACQQEGLAI